MNAQLRARLLKPADPPAEPAPRCVAVASTRNVTKDAMSITAALWHIAGIQHLLRGTTPAGAQ